MQSSKKSAAEKKNHATSQCVVVICQRMHLARVVATCIQNAVHSQLWLAGARAGAAARLEAGAGARSGAGAAARLARGARACHTAACRGSGVAPLKARNDVLSVHPAQLDVVRGLLGDNGDGGRQHVAAAHWCRVVVAHHTAERAVPRGTACANIQHCVVGREPTRGECKHSTQWCEAAQKDRVQQSGARVKRAQARRARSGCVHGRRAGGQR